MYTVKIPFLTLQYVLTSTAPVTACANERARPKENFKNWTFHQGGFHGEKEPTMTSSVPKYVPNILLHHVQVGLK
jgi:hypothetical protein